MSNKEMVMDALRKMPEEVSMEQIIEELNILAAIRRGERAADEGRVVPHEHVKQRSAQWTSN
jgi:predicted transcriptional regulator